MVDSRDGQFYTTKQYGSKCWMTQNLNYATSGICYAGNASNCTIYGRLYGYSTVNTTSVCPSGWHVPDLTEWMALNNLYGTGCLANGSWNCNPAGTALKVGGVSGFNALLGGILAGSSYSSIGTGGYYWVLSNYLEMFYTSYTTVAVSYLSTSANLYYLSVRCVKN